MKSQADKKIMRHSHGGFAGRSLIERIEAQMDKRRKRMEGMVVQHGLENLDMRLYNMDRGRYEGLAAALAILRSSSVAQEVSRSNERLGIE
jgi:hypothetical protein